MSAAIAYFWLTQQTIELLTFGLDSHKYFGEAVVCPCHCCVRVTGTLPLPSR